MELDQPVDAGHGRSGPSPVLERFWLGALIVAQAVVMFTAGIRQYFVFDDWLNLILAAESDLDWSYLTRPVFGHFVPLHRLGSWLIADVFTLDHMVVVAAFTAMLVASTVLIYLILRRLFGTAWISVVLVTVFAMSSLFAHSLFWWSTGMHQIPSITLSLASVYLFIRALDGTRWLLVPSVLAFAGALMFYELPLFTIWTLWLVLVVRRRASRPGPIVQAVASGWRLWIWHLLVGLAYTGYVLTAIERSTETATATETAAFLVVAFAMAFMPGYLGVGGLVGSGGHQFIPDDPVAVTTIGVAASLALFAIFVIATIVRSRSAVIGWLYFFGGFLVMVGLIAYGRAGIFGSSNDFRYVVESTYLFTLGAATAWLAPVWATPIEVSPAPTPPSRRLRIAVGAGVAVVVGLSVLSMIRLGSSWAGERAEAYVANMRTDLAMARQGPLELHDLEVPFYLGTIAPYNRYSRFVPLIQGEDGGEITYVVEGEGALFDESGHLRPARFFERSTVTPTGGPPPLCIDGTGRAEYVVNNELDERVWIVELSYTSATPVTPRLWAMNSSGVAGPRLAEPSLPAGEHTVSFSTLRQAPVGLAIEAPPGAGLCIEHIRLGALAPVP